VVRNKCTSAAVSSSSFKVEILVMKNLIFFLICGHISTCLYAQPDSAKHYYDKGLAEQQARRFREAEKHFAKSSTFSASNTDVFNQWGKSLVEQRRYAEARDKFQKAYQLDSRNAEAIENMAELSMNTRQWNDAVIYAKKMQELKIGKSAAFIIAKSMYEQQNYGEALKYCEMAFKEDPARAETPYIAGRSLVEMSNYKKAAGCYEQAIERDSSKASWMYEAALVFYAR
jgi:tetratricopeptide (TPR) repeat protein